MTVVFMGLVALLFILRAWNQSTMVADTDDRAAREMHMGGVFNVDKETLLGQFDPAISKAFVQIRTPYANRDGLYLLKDVYEAFLRMHRAAQAEGISLVIVSATRNFEAQKRIWEGKWTGKRLVDSQNLALTVPDPVDRARVILRFSSMPGTSRHHWGTDVDINSVDPTYFESGMGLKAYQWLEGHAARFGFIQTYTSKGKARPKGYEEEPWHWSYNPIARLYTRQYVEKVGYGDITGFIGSDTASEIEVIQDYVLGINPDGLK